MNWVERRHECNARHAFDELRSGAETNITTRSQQLQAGTRVPAELLPQLGAVTEDSFLVSRNGRTVKFERTDYRTIRVNGDDISAFTIHVGLDDDGRCALTVAGEPTENWQILYKALDKLLF